MPHYYFNLHNGDITLDGEGRQFADLTAATLYATEAVRLLAADSVATGHLSVHDRVDITDEQCRVLASVSVEQAVAISYRKRAQGSG